ncbi:MAG TPA: DASS family sodium-coupled anion symporter [Acidimicrobiia bacterium]|nr:DASS family sodium-coupled anion symporter [Acidimicrobiia bacterium]
MAWALGAALAVAGWLVAPADWEAGPGRVAVEYRNELVVDAPVELGDEEAASVAGERGDLRVSVVFPTGVPVEGSVRTLVTVEEAGTRLRPALQDVEVGLVLGDGRRELVPTVEWDEEAGALVASRRPTRGAPIVAALLAFVVVMWVSEALPLFVTSLAIPVVLVVAGLAGAADATAPFFNPIIVLFFAGFLMAEAMHRSGLDHYVSVQVTARAGRSAVALFATMLALAAFLSMWMSNTAATAVLVPIAMAISEPLRHAGFRRALVLGIAYAATIGGVGSAIGTPANQLAIEFLGTFGGRSIAFAEWFAFGVPMVVLFLPIMGFYLWWRSGVTLDPTQLGEARRVAVAERARLGRPTRDQITVLAVFGLVMLAWLTETYHGVHAGIVALGGAVALFVLRRLRAEDLGRISWASLLTFGGGLTLGLYLVDTGTSDYVATRLANLASLPGIVAVGAVALIGLLLTTVASNTASAAISIPLAIPLAAVLGLEPTMLVVVVAIATSVDFALVIGTPPTMIAYSTGLYTAGRVFRLGAVLDLVGVALLVLVVSRLWEVFGLI